MKTLEHTSSIPSLKKSRPEECHLVILGRYGIKQGARSAN